MPVFDSRPGLSLLIVEEGNSEQLHVSDVRGFSLAPLDTPAWSETSYLLNLYDVPSEFIAERSRGVTHSFGTRRSNDGWQGKG